MAGRVTDVSEGHQDPAPLLTIAVPTYQRPDLLRRALASIVQAITEPSAVEVVISDNSPDVSGPEIERFRAAWTGRLRYLPNVPTIDTVSNWNQCIKVATGRYVLFIHDDDYLLPDVGPDCSRPCAGRRLTSTSSCSAFASSPSRDGSVASRRTAASVASVPPRPSIGS